MADFPQDVLVSVWREVGRHERLAVVLERLAGILSPHLPFDLLMIRRIDAGRSLVETLAAAARQGAAAPPSRRDELRYSEAAALVQAGRSSDALIADVGEAGAIAAGLAPAGVLGSVAASPIGNPQEAPTFLVLVAFPGKRFSEDELAALKLLRDPLQVALENDRRIHELIASREAIEADVRTLRSRLGPAADREIVGVKTGLAKVMERVQLVASSDVPVLILGETGSGKEVVARAIHTGSPRSQGPFLRVNCGAIPPELIDSELFGHEKGSFTGATTQRKGWFERADGGTLFLDECGELPLAAQVRLLRILQDGTFERVGGETQNSVDVRIVAATHRDLHSMVADGEFRQDLWYRLAVFPIHLPPLRERVEDVAEMAARFAQRAAERFGLHAAPLTSEDVQVLVSYSWPGNVRELRTVIERAVILGEGRRLEIAKALGAGAAPPRPAPAGVWNNPSRINGYSPLNGVVAPNGRRHEAPAAEPLLSLDAAMARHIEKALSCTNGCIEGKNGAAKLLRINPHTLRARMRKLGVDWKRFRTAALSDDADH